MYPEIIQIDGNIELVQNSGVQFVDYEVLLNWKTKDRHSIIPHVEKGYFEHIPNSRDEPWVRLVPRIENEDVAFYNPVTKRRVDPSDYDPLSLKQSLKLYDGVWFPIPYLPEHAQGQFGPINWARARVVKVEDSKLIAEARARQAMAKFGSESIDEAEGYSSLDAGLANSGVSESFEEASRGLNHNSAAQQLNSNINPNLNAAGFGGNATSFGNNAAGFGSTTAGFGAGANAQDNNRRNDEVYYRVVLAFDTHTQYDSENFGYLAPTESDVESGIRFRFAYKQDDASRTYDFMKPIGSGVAWVREWAEAVFKDLYRERLYARVQEDEFQEKIEREREPEKHYLNMLAFIGLLVNPADVHFISNPATTSYANGRSSSSTIDVSLILDIGNSRTCGILVEDHPNATRSDDDFSDTYVLTLRDLNAPEQVYNQAFASRVEFAKPNFEYGGCSARSTRPDAFSWPSIVRVGTEAQKLAAHREGNEGISGLSSPKRYLWDKERLVNDSWFFNNFSYQIESKTLEKRQKSLKQRAYLNPSSNFFNSDGNAFFALSKDDTELNNLESRYSNRSTMTFMLIEILLHAMTQMNSPAQRTRCTSKDTPRRLKAIIITTPPGMPAEEKELYRACVYEALGILWKSLGFDRTPANQFKFKVQLHNDVNGDGVVDEVESTDIISPAVPEVYMDWNEAEAGQVVYIYNESQKTYKGDCQAFIRYLRRMQFGQRLGEILEDADGDALLSARIASLDIGGGTTDLVIKDYTIKRDVPSYADDIKPHEVLRDGAKLAGDDIVHDLIKHYIITPLAKHLRIKYGIDGSQLLQQLVGSASMGTVQDNVLRSLFTQQILVVIAYKILFHLENLDPFAAECRVTGTVRDFINDKEFNPSLPLTVRRMGAFTQPSAEVVGFADGIIGSVAKGFSIMDFLLDFDLVEINQDMVSGMGFDVFRVLGKFCEVISTFNCDLLILTGRSSKLPAIREFFMQRLNMPSSRILAMHNYRCGSWYPFQRDGEMIGDPKTTASVGALICYLRSKHSKFPNFRFLAQPDTCNNNAHYVGVLNNVNMITDSSVLYKYESAKMLAKMNQSDEDDEISNFVPYKRKTDEFKTKLSVEIGYRLLDDPNFEATPLYKIEACSSADEMESVRKASILSCPDLSRESLKELIYKLDGDLQAEAESKIEEVLTQMDTLPQQVELYTNQLVQALTSAIEQESVVAVPEVSGIKSWFGGKDKVKSERQAWCFAQYNERCESEVKQPAALYGEQLKQDLENKLTSIVNDLLFENKSRVRTAAENKLKKLKSKLDGNREQFNVTLRVVNKKSPYPLAFILENEPSLKKIETFELERVCDESGTDFTKCFKMYLKTISGSKIKYFMDSGSINLDGIQF